MIINKDWCMSKIGNNYNEYEVYDTANGQTVAYVRGQDDNKENAQAIMHLPELLDVLNYVRRFYQDNFDVMPVAFQTVDHEIEAALIKAGVEVGR